MVTEPSVTVLEPDGENQGRLCHTDRPIWAAGAAAAIFAQGPHHHIQDLDNPGQPIRFTHRTSKPDPHVAGDASRARSAWLLRRSARWSVESMAIVSRPGQVQRTSLLARSGRIRPLGPCLTGRPAAAAGVRRRAAPAPALRLSALPPSPATSRRGPSRRERPSWPSFAVSWPCASPAIRRCAS